MKTIILLAGWMIGMSLASCNKKTATEPPACCKKEAATAEADAHPDRSLYQLTGSWTNQQSEKMTLNQLEGKWQLTAMIFTSCGYACPRMVENMQAIEDQLPDEVKKNISFLLVSFDTKKDTPERLHEYAVDHKLDRNWTLLHGNTNEVRMMSMLLNIKYELLPNGAFNHSNAITLLNAEGVAVKRFEGLNIPVEATAREIAALVGQ